jgi:hypothetical protein
MGVLVARLSYEILIDDDANPAASGARPALFAASAISLLVDVPLVAWLVARPSHPVLVAAAVWGLVNLGYATEVIAAGLAHESGIVIAGIAALCTITAVVARRLPAGP